MNLLRFLKSTQGAIKMANLSVLASVAAAGVFYVGANTAANHQIAKQRVRTLGELAQTSPQEGMQRQGGMLTSINVKDALGQIATADDLASMQDDSPLARYQRNQDALGNMESSLGRAAQLADSAQFGADTNYELDSSRYSVGNPRAGAIGTSGNVVADAYNAASVGGSTGGQSGQNQLASASMARATGSNFNATSGSIGGAGQSGSTVAGQQRLSGSMPGGSNIVTRMGLEGALASGRNTSSFGDRDARIGQGSRVKSEGNELKDILKKSAAGLEAAQQGKAGGSEGSKAFLAGSTTSGGVTVDGAGEGNNTATSADLAAPTANKLKAIGNHLNEEQKKQDERNRAHRALVAQLIATLAGSIGAIIIGANILTKLDKMIMMEVAAAFADPTPAGKIAHLKVAAALKIKRRIYAIGMVALAGAANAWLFINAKKFVSDYGAYGGTTVATIAQIVSVLTVAAAVQTAITPSWKGFIKTAWAKAKQLFNPVGLLMPKI